MAEKYRFLAIFLIIITFIELLLILFLIFPQNNKMNNIDNIAVLETNLGVIKIELYTEKMPITTGNFIKLINEGYYDGIKFHRVIEDFMIQAGDPLTKNESKIGQWGSGGPGYTIEDEFVKNLSNLRGTISMANTGAKNSGGSQFFINLNDNLFLDFDKEPLSSKHPVFGMVIEGMDIVDKISKVPKTASDMPIEHVIIEKAYMSSKN